MVADIPKVKPTDVLKELSWTAKACFLIFMVAVFASIACGVFFAGLKGVFFLGLVLIGAAFLCCFAMLYARTKKALDERRERLIEQSKTLAPVSPEWEKIRTEMSEIKGRLVKEILKKRSINPQQELLNDFLKKK